METIEVSLCCKADLIEDHKVDLYHDKAVVPIYVCSQCKKECEGEEVCAFCRGTGERDIDERDSDGNWQLGVATVTCHCRKLATEEIAY